MRKTVSQGLVRVDWDSAHELAVTAKPRGDTWHAGSYYSNTTRREAKAQVLRGAPKYVQGIEKLLTELDVTIETPRRAWLPDVAGGYPIVAEYLAGFPMAMRRRQWIASESAPVRIVVELFASAGINASHLVTRGACVLALVSKLGATRPVDVTCVLSTEQHGGPRHLQTIPIDTQPLDLAHAAAVLAEPNFLRGFGFDYAVELGAGSCPSPDYSNPNAYQAWMRECLGMSPSDILLDACRLESPWIVDPVKFVRDTIARLGEA